MLLDLERGGYTADQAAQLNAAIGSCEAQLGMIVDSLAVLNKTLPDCEAGTRAAYALVAASELLGRLSAARIETDRYRKTRPSPSELH